MNLKQYSKDFGAKALKELANKTSTNVIYLYQIASNIRQPSPKLCVKIENATKGVVTKYDLRSDAELIWGSESKRDQGNMEL